MDPIDLFFSIFHIYFTQFQMFFLSEVTLRNKRSIRGPSTLWHPSEIQQLAVSFGIRAVTSFVQGILGQDRAGCESHRLTHASIMDVVPPMLLDIPWHLPQHQCDEEAGSQALLIHRHVKAKPSIPEQGWLGATPLLSPGNPPITQWIKKDWCTVHAWGPPSTVCSLWPGCFRRSWYATADYYAAMQGCCNQQVVGGSSLVVWYSRNSLWFYDYNESLPQRQVPPLPTFNEKTNQKLALAILWEPLQLFSNLNMYLIYKYECVNIWRLSLSLFRSYGYCK